MCTENGGVKTRARIVGHGGPSGPDGLNASGCNRVGHAESGRSATDPLRTLGSDVVRQAMADARHLAIGATVLLAACGSWEGRTSAVAPDGKAIAQIEVKLRGASSSNLTRVILRNGRGGSLPRPVYVVEADGAIVDFTTLRWAGADRLIVALCDATSYRVTAENLRNPPIIDVGREDGTGDVNRIKVDVVNLTYVEAEKSCRP